MSLTWVEENNLHLQQSWKNSQQNSIKSLFFNHTLLRTVIWMTHWLGKYWLPTTITFKLTSRSNGKQHRTNRTVHIKSNQQRKSPGESSKTGKKQSSSGKQQNTPSTAVSIRTGPTFGIPARKTLVLDLDETLVHADQHGGPHVDHVVEVMMEGHAQLYFVSKRPHTDYFLNKVSQWYELVIFTASLPEYADPVIDWLDPDRRYFKKRLFRDACTPRGFSFTKDLTLAESDLSRVVLVDNSPISYAMHKGE
jgi:Dullard-like phosphatase family protein